VNGFHGPARPATKLAHHGVKRRCEQQTNPVPPPQDSGENRVAQRLPHPGAGAGGDHQRRAAIRIASRRLDLFLARPASDRPGLSCRAVQAMCVMSVSGSNAA
jgi:hypothetical protein